MKKLLLLIFIFFPHNTLANDTIRFVDLNKILLTSEAGKDINIKINELSKTELSKFDKKKENLIDKENKLIAQKNILEADIYNKELENLKNEIDNYNKSRKDKIKELKIKQSNAKTKLLQEINIILSEYASSNSISLILNKQSIAAGKKELEITNEIKDNLNKKIKTIKIE